MEDPRLLCIIVPCYDEEQVIERTYEELKRVLSDLVDYRHLLYFVDDGSTDTTLYQLNAIARRDDTVRVISLSRNFGHQVAITAGLDLADRRADAVLVMDADLENPPALIPKMLEELERGHDVVMGVRRKPRAVSLWRRVASRGFYWVFNKLGDVRVEPGAPDFFVLSRRAREALSRMPEQRRFLRGMVAWIGFSRTHVPYVPPARAAGTTKYSLARMLRFAGDALFAFSSVPTRLMLLSGAMCFVLGLCATTVTFVRILLSLSVPTPLWVCALMLSLTGIQLCALGIVGGYVARLFEESRGRPSYLLKQAPDDLSRAQDARVLRPRSSRRISSS